MKKQPELPDYVRNMEIQQSLERMGDLVDDVFELDSVSQAVTDVDNSTP